jgi:hypothetical protein
MNRTSVALAAVFLSCASTGRTAAQTSFEVRGVTVLPADARISMARSALPSWQLVPAGGATLRSMLQSVCGSGQGPQVDRELESLVLKLNGGDSVDRKVNEGVAVAIPFCLKHERRVKVTVESGDTLEGLLLEHYGLAGSDTKRETLALNDPDRRWASVEEFSRSLKPGQEIVLPYAAAGAVFTPSTVPLDSVTLSTASAHEVLAPPPPTLHEIIAATGSPKAALVESTARPVREPPRGEIEFNYVRFVSATEAGKWCASPTGDAAPFDVALLKRRFEAEVGLAGPFLTGGPNLIGLIDSGIGSVDTPPFAGFLRPNPKELVGRPAEDDDNPENHFIDDIYGINFNAPAENGSVLSYEGADPDFEHGTKVGTIVLGGKAWLDQWPAGQPPWAQLKIVNFSSATKPHPVEAVHLLKAIHYLLALDVRVVNMSLENRLPIDGIRNVIGNAGRTLFVAAAGNRPAGGEDLILEPVYPAADGGETAHTLLIVGAHSLDPKRLWAGFSNHSNKRVDLLAPGCNVPTLSVKGLPVTESGTSIATAFASFAAGLLGALGETASHAIKNRLLVSVDIDPALAKHVYSSGRLNIVKAVSLSTDVIEKTDAALPYEFGRIANRDELRRFCGDDKLRTKLNRMRKIRPNVSTEEGTRVQYWVENDGSLGWVDCPQINSNQSIGDVEVDGQQQPGPPLAAVRDIVLADRRR